MTPNVMIIDDSEDQLELIKAVFESVAPHIIVSSASSGEKSLDILRDKTFSYPKVILLDLNMPRLDGYEVLSILKSDNDLKHIPICVFSASDLQSDICKSYRLGASFFFKKPTGLQNIKEFVNAFTTIWFNFAGFCEHHHLQNC